MTCYSATILIRRDLEVYEWRSKDELICDLLQLTSTRGHVSFYRPARTYLHRICSDTGSSLEDLPGAMDDRNGGGKRESGKSMLSAKPDDDDTII